MRYGWNGENMFTDLVSAIVSAGTNWVTTTMALDGQTKWSVITDGILGVGGIALKNYASSPMMHEILEAVGYSGFSGLGAWAAAAMKKKNSIPVWLPGTATASFVRGQGVGAALLPPRVIQPQPQSFEPGYSLGYEVGA